MRWSPIVRRPSPRNAATWSVLVAGLMVAALLAAAPVVAQDEAATASVVFEDQPTGGTTVVVANVTVPEGGFVTIHNESLLDGDALGSVVGVSGFLANGTHENVTVTLDAPITNDTTLIAMPHLDTNGNQEYDFVTSQGADDGPYTADGSAVTDAAMVTATATVTFEDQTVQDGQVTVQRVEMARGGFVTMHDASLLEGAALGSVVGWSAFLAAGAHENVMVELTRALNGTETLLAMPHEDSNGNETYDFVASNGTADPPYVFNGSAVTDPAEVQAEATGDGGNGGNGGNGMPAPGLVLVAAGALAAARWRRRR